MRMEFFEFVKNAVLVYYTGVVHFGIQNAGAKV